MSESSMHPPAAVYVQTNQPQNQVLALRRAVDGNLAPIGAFDTGGAGSDQPHLASQGSVVLSGDAAHLLVTNVASDDVSLFAVRPDGGLDLLGTARTGGAPKSLAEHDRLVYVLNTGKPGVSGFRIGDRALEPVLGSEHALSAPNADPAQVGFSPDGRALVVTERGTDSIVVFDVGPRGVVGEPRMHPSSGPTPYGFGFTSGGTLVVTEAFRAQKGQAAASSYRLEGTSLTPVTRSLGNGRSEICWAVVSPDDRYAFTTNFADGAVSCYAIDGDGTLTLQDAAAGVSVEGRPGLRDEALTRDGRYLYAVDADAGSIFGWMTGERGALTPIGSWTGLPPSAAGLAAA